mmetsp:Transcript_11919/g.38307  ORF Transcript_11919/g.38307 Transcript_11919/m.38307 type:complete len:343 (+) Transcript_11919:229-1257(+)
MRAGAHRACGKLLAAGREQRAPLPRANQPISRPRAHHEASRAVSRPGAAARAGEPPPDVCHVGPHERTSQIRCSGKAFSLSIARTTSSRALSRSREGSCACWVAGWAGACASHAQPARTTMAASPSADAVVSLSQLCCSHKLSPPPARPLFASGLGARASGGLTSGALARAPAEQAAGAESGGVGGENGSGAELSSCRRVGPETAKAARKDARKGRKPCSSSREGMRSSPVRTRKTTVLHATAQARYPAASSLREVGSGCTPKVAPPATQTVRKPSLPSAKLSTSRASSAGEQTRAWISRRVGPQTTSIVVARATKRGEACARLAAAIAAKPAAAKTKAGSV